MVVRQILHFRDVKEAAEAIDGDVNRPSRQLVARQVLGTMTKNARPKQLHDTEPETVVRREQTV